MLIGLRASEGRSRVAEELSPLSPVVAMVKQ